MTKKLLTAMQDNPGFELIKTNKILRWILKRETYLFYLLKYGVTDSRET